MNDYKIKKIKGHKIHIYSDNAFKHIEKAGKLARDTLDHVHEYVKPGISTEEINKICHDFIVKHNAVPAPLNYNGFPKSVCTSINHIVCHGIPSAKVILKEGDIINIDVTAILNGYYGDTSRTFAVGKISKEARELMNATELCLNKAIKAIGPGVSTLEIGKTIQSIVDKSDFSIVKELCGHGIGNEFHQDPNVLHYYPNPIDILIEPGMVFTIEPMINQGVDTVATESDNWTVVTTDGKLSAQYEHTLGVDSNGQTVIFTR